MAPQDDPPQPRPGAGEDTVRIVVGVDGSGRSHRLGRLAATRTSAVRLTAPLPDPERLAAVVQDCAANGRAAVIDDVHRLDDPSLRTLTEAVRGGGLDLVVCRRPSIHSPALAELDEALAQRGSIQALGPLDADALEDLLVEVTGRRPSPEEVERVLVASGGLAAVAVAVAAAPGPAAVPALIARVHRRLSMMDPATATLARLLAVRVDVGDDVLAAASESDSADLADRLRELTDQGMLLPDGERLVPAVAEAIDEDAGPAGRRTVRERLATALADSGGDPLDVAPLLRAARARGVRAAQVFVAAAQAVRITAPADALGWLDDAADATDAPEGGTSAARVIRAEASALLGLPVDTTPALHCTPEEMNRLRLVDAALTAQQGRTARSADLLRDAGELGRALAVPALVATGRRPQSAPEHGPSAVARLVEAAMAAAHPADAVPLFIDAAEIAESVAPQVVWPDTAHAVGALVAVCAGDTPTAEGLLARAAASGFGGPAAAERHRLLLAWVRMRAGCYDTALAEVRRIEPAQTTGRDRLIRAALLAGLARRSGDISRLRQAWTAVEPVLARRAVDLFHVEVVEELAAAAARLRMTHRVEPVIALIDDQLSGLGRPPAWATALVWVRVQMAVAGDAPEALARAAEQMAEISPQSLRENALHLATRVWAEVAAGTVAVGRVEAALDALSVANLPWEASRLAGHAAITTEDRAGARRLLERARELSGAEPRTAEQAGPASGGAGGRALHALSEREIEVSRLVLEGRTHREIGAQLFLSPKTVEHHVARIRTKLGATSRADMLAALRDLLD